MEICLEKILININDLEKMKLLLFEHDLKHEIFDNIRNMTIYEAKECHKEKIDQKELKIYYSQFKNFRHKIINTFIKL